MNVTANGLRLISGLTMSGIITPLPPPLIRLLATLSLSIVVYEAVNESFLSHKRWVEHGIAFLSENHGFRMEIIIVGSTITFLRLIFLSY